MGETLGVSRSFPSKWLWSLFRVWTAALNIAPPSASGAVDVVDAGG